MTKTSAVERSKGLSESARIEQLTEIYRNRRSLTDHRGGMPLSPGVSDEFVTLKQGTGHQRGEFEVTVRHWADITRFIVLPTGEIDLAMRWTEPDSLQVGINKEPIRISSAKEALDAVIIALTARISDVGQGSALREAQFSGEHRKSRNRKES